MCFDPFSRYRRIISQRSINYPDCHFYPQYPSNPGIYLHEPKKKLYLKNFSPIHTAILKHRQDKQTNIHKSYITPELESELLMRKIVRARDSIIRPCSKVQYRIYCGIVIVVLFSSASFSYDRQEYNFSDHAIQLNYSNDALLKLHITLKLVQ